MLSDGILFLHKQCYIPTDSSSSLWKLEGQMADIICENQGKNNNKALSISSLTITLDTKFHAP